MNDNDRWRILQEEAKQNAKLEFLETLLSATGLKDYITDMIAAHESQMHNND